MPEPAQQIGFQEYLHGITELGARIARRLLLLQVGTAAGGQVKPFAIDASRVAKSSRVAA